MELKKTLAVIGTIAVIGGGTIYTIEQPIEVTLQREVKVVEPITLEVRRFSGYLNFVRPDGHGVLIPENAIPQYLEEVPLTDWEREIREAVRAANDNDPELKRTTKITIE